MRAHSDTITSEANGRVKEIMKLQKSSRERKKKRLFVAEGSRMLEEAFLYGKLQSVYFSESFREPDGREWETLRREVPCEVIADSIFKKIADTVTPQGVLGVVRMPEYAPEEILADERHCYMLTDDIRDPGNLGTIMRTAEGAGMSGVILSRGTVDLFNPKVVRATMGAVFRVPFYCADDMCGMIEKLRTNDIPVYGMMLQGSVLYDEPDYVRGAGIVVGNEANGISPETARFLTGTVRIPMEGKLESLNAAVSAGVLMYEVARQRRLAHPDTVVL